MVSRYGVRACPPTSAASAAASLSAASATASVPVAAGNLQVGFVAGHANAETMTLGSGFTPEDQRQSAGSRSIATVLTGYAISGPSGNFTATFPTAMYWPSGAAVFGTA